jgi:single-strand DNA-binding protein
MSSINVLTLVGNLTRDPELKFVGANNTALATTGIACNRKFKDKEEVMFIDLTFFGGLAEIVNEYLVKGSQIAVQGYLKLETWETDGQRRSKHTMVVENMQMLGKKPESDKPATTKSKSSGKTKSEETVPSSEESIPF